MDAPQNPNEKKRQVTREQGLAYSRQVGFRYLEVEYYLLVNLSSNLDENVEETFSDLIMLISRNIKDGKENIAGLLQSGIYSCSIGKGKDRITYFSALEAHKIGMDGVTDTVDWV